MLNTPQKQHKMNLYLNVVKERIIYEIKKYKYFSVLAVETTDIPNNKQMDLAIRYFDSKCITEMFIYFIVCENHGG